MKIIKLFKEKAKDNIGKPSPTIAFLGDSVTQGCFEIYKKTEKDIETIFDQNYAYHTYLKKALTVLFPSVPVNVINAGISGDCAPHALERLERDVLKYNPDLVVVCFGLNDVFLEIKNYTTALDGIFKKLNEYGCEVIFMTPNTMNTYISPHIIDEDIREIAERHISYQKDGIMDIFMDAAREVCAKNKVPVCDCYAKWKLMADNGVDTTELLSNKLNHPSRDMNWLFAVSLLETMMK